MACALKTFTTGSSSASVQLRKSVCRCFYCPWVAKKKGWIPCSVALVFPRNGNHQHLEQPFLTSQWADSTEIFRELMLWQPDLKSYSIAVKVRDLLILQEVQSKAQSFSKPSEQTNLFLKVSVVAGSPCLIKPGERTELKCICFIWSKARHCQLLESTKFSRQPWGTWSEDLWTHTKIFVSKLWSLLQNQRVKLCCPSKKAFSEQN